MPGIYASKPDPSERPAKRQVEIGEERGETRRDVDLVLHVELGALDQRVIHSELRVFVQEIHLVRQNVREARDKRRPVHVLPLVLALLHVVSSPFPHFHDFPARRDLFEQRHVLERLVHDLLRAQLEHAQRRGQRLHSDDLAREQRPSIHH